MKQCALATGAIIDAESSRADAAQYLGSPGGHTPSVITYSVKPMRPRLSLAARGNLTE